MVHHSGSIQSFKQQKGMHTSISEILKEKTLKPSRRSLPCLVQSRTHPQNLNHGLSVPLNLNPSPKPRSGSPSCPDISHRTDGGKDLYAEVSEAGTYESRTDESLLIRTPGTRAKLEARTESLKKSNPVAPSGLLFRDGKKRIDYILVYKKSSPQVEKRCTFERNLRAEGLMLEREVRGLHFFWPKHTPSDLKNVTMVLKHQ